MFKIKVIDTRPNIYKIGIWRALAKSNLFEEHVYFCCNDGVKKDFYDASFNTSRRSDTWLLNGFSYSFPKNYSKLKSVFFQLINLSVFLDLIRDDYDFILIQGYNNIMYILALMIAKVRRKKVIFRGEAVLRGSESVWTAKLLFKKLVTKLVFNFSDVILYSCTGNKEFFEYFGAHPRKLRFFPCAVDNEFYSNSYEQHHPNANRIKSKLGIHNEDLVMVFAARFVERKYPMNFLKAVSIIDHKNVSLLFIGDGPEKEAMQSFADQHNIKAIFTGFKEQEEISEYYSIGDVCVINSSYDPSPKVLNEAMNFAMAVVVTENIGTARDLVEPGANGFIVKAGNIDDLARKLKHCATNRQQTYSMGQYSKEIVGGWRFSDDIKALESYALGYES